MDLIVYALCKKYAKDYTDAQIAAIGKGMEYKGSVATYSDLPVTGNKKGYVYTVSDTHEEYIWTIDATSGALTDWESLGVKIKTVNGQSLIGDGNVDVRTYQPYNTSWGGSSETITVAAFCTAILADTAATTGMAYNGTIASSSFFSGITGLNQAEVNVQIMGTSSQKVILLTATSFDVSPYHWELTYYNGVTTPVWRSLGISYSAGNGIDINNNSISTKASVGVRVDSNGVSCTGVEYYNNTTVQSNPLKFIRMTAAQYAAITPDNDTFYIIIG